MKYRMACDLCRYCCFCEVCDGDEVCGFFSPVGIIADTYTEVEIEKGREVFYSDWFSYLKNSGYYDD